MKYLSLKQRFEPYRDVIIFMVTLLVANLVWKWAMKGDEDGVVVTCFGRDVTAVFEWMACHITRVVYALVSFVRDTASMPDPHTIRFASGSGTVIIWGCTGLKQAFIWFCLITTVLPANANANAKANADSNAIAKLWFIPLGWLACYIFNILRLFIITLSIEYHPEWFPILHDYIFKYLFYGMLFGLWVIFVEKIRPCASTN